MRTIRTSLQVVALRKRLLSVTTVNRAGRRGARRIDAKKNGRAAS